MPLGIQIFFKLAGELFPHSVFLTVNSIITVTEDRVSRDNTPGIIFRKLILTVSFNLLFNQKLLT